MRRPLPEPGQSSPRQGRGRPIERRSLQAAARTSSGAGIQPGARTTAPMTPSRFPHSSQPSPRGFLLVRFSNAGRHRTGGNRHAAARIEKPPTMRTLIADPRTSACAARVYVGNVLRSVRYGCDHVTLTELTLPKRILASRGYRSSVSSIGCACGTGVVGSAHRSRITPECVTTSGREPDRWSSVSSMRVQNASAVSPPSGSRERSLSDLGRPSKTPQWRSERPETNVTGRPRCAPTMVAVSSQRDSGLE